MSRSDTIFALSTPKGKSGVAIIRISGPHALSTLGVLGAGDTISPRVATCRILHDGKGRPIDRAVVIYFPGPNSFTGEDVIELQVHGSIAVIRLLFEELQVPFRIADPGEFSLRAFLNGRIDLTKAEGIADLINSETEAQLRQAFAQSSGGLEKLYEGWRRNLIDILSDLEAYIDFPEDITDSVLEAVYTKLQRLKVSLSEHLNDDNRGERLKTGLRIAIVGKPNVGKSTLFNHLVRRNIAIVSEYPGTTRDVLEAQIDIGGYPFVLIDTAGVRESSDFVEAEGIRRAIMEAKNADIRIVVHSSEDAKNSLDLGEFAEACGDEDIYILSKADDIQNEAQIMVQGRALYPISVHSGLGISSLLSVIKEKAMGSFPKDGDVFITSQRHRNHLRNAADAISEIGSDMPVEIMAEHLRVAAQEIGRITGAVYGDDILDGIFKKFCIGK